MYVLVRDVYMTVTTGINTVNYMSDLSLEQFQFLEVLLHLFFWVRFHYNTRGEILWLFCPHFM